ncbi:MAG: peptide deformylase [Chloroflexi bacterium]|nr:peptide deformylase [Chloroflexota bacterium]
MAVLPIIVVGDPILRKRTRRVPTVHDTTVQRLIDDMIETMRTAHGVGLAAPQVGVSLRLAVVGMPEQPVLVLVNPRVLRRSGKRQVEEGCLSIPGYVGLVTRSVRVSVAALDRTGAEYRVLGATGLLAQALEHEIDHLNGILYLDHLVAHDALRRAGVEVADHPVIEEPAPATVGLDG